MFKFLVFAAVTITLSLLGLRLAIVEQELQKAVILLPALLAVMVTLYYEVIDDDDDGNQEAVL